MLESIFLAGERYLGGWIVAIVRLWRRAFAHRKKRPAPPLPAPWSAEPRWSREGRPPRARNRLTPLVDGEAFYTCLHQALSEARRYVFIAGWCLTPYTPLLRNTAEDLVRMRLLDVLSETASSVPVRLLLWGGAPMVIKPTRRVAEQVAHTVNAEGSGDIVCRLDTTPQFSHSHHQKAIVIDGRLAFVGGMDLTTFAGDRWDQRSHPLRAGVNWHDVTFLVEGEAVTDVEENFRQRWEDATNDRTLPSAQAPEIEPEWQTPVQMVRTIPAGRYRFAPEGEYGIRHAYLELIAGAQRFIYLESQYLWAPEIIDALTDRIKHAPSPSFRIVIVLPARATSGKWDNDKHVAALRRADGGRGIAEVYSLFTSGPTTGQKPFRYRPVYVHAKLGVFDDEWLIAGSANLNDRGLITDSEICILARDPPLARRFRCDLWAEHLNLPLPDIENADPTTLADDAWRRKAAENARLMRDGEQPLPSSVHLYAPGHVPGAWVLDETESLTFEH